jgi:8-oxo-dGTP diphosphatase
MTVYAAGAVLWREEKGALQLALVHRGRYNDYGWAKGKLDPGEVLPQTAVREVLEETGLKIKLGVKLPVQRYKLPSGEPKEVHFWAARVSDSALAGSKFVPHEEVAEVIWAAPDKVASLLSYDADKELLKYVVSLYNRELLYTKPFVVLRHAKATPRTDWKGPDGKRTLLSSGKAQAKALIPVLNAFGPKKIVTSPWVRCLTTVEPYAKKYKFPIVERIALSEHGNANGPARTKNVVRDLIDTQKPALLCSHRPSLPSIIDELSENATLVQKKELQHGLLLKPGHLMVVHMTVEPKGHRRQIASIEQYSSFLAD